jgi:hypothetical protein
MAFESGSKQESRFPDKMYFSKTWVQYCLCASLFPSKGGSPILKLLFPRLRYSITSSCEAIIPTTCARKEDHYHLGGDRTKEKESSLYEPDSGSMVNCVYHAIDVDVKELTNLLVYELISQRYFSHLVEFSQILAIVLAAARVRARVGHHTTVRAQGAS